MVCSNPLTAFEPRLRVQPQSTRPPPRAPSVAMARAQPVCVRRPVFPAATASPQQPSQTSGGSDGDPAETTPAPENSANTNTPRPTEARSRGDDELQHPPPEPNAVVALHQTQDTITVNLRAQQPVTTGPVGDCLRALSMSTIRLAYR